MEMRKDDSFRNVNKEEHEEERKRYWFRFVAVRILTKSNIQRS